jgi:hydrogenase nickel incorporation protein HypB
MELKVISNVLRRNDEIAKENRDFFCEKRVFVVNFMGSPGAGKTSLILNTIKKLKDEFKIGVIEGDIATTIDAEKIIKMGVCVVQINTDGACHLDANMVKLALKEIDVKALDLLFIENVGNLVCPSNFDLGEDLKVVVLSVPEGDDKPKKYPGIFHIAGAVLLNKIDLFGHFEFNRVDFFKEILNIKPDIRTFEISCKNGSGIDLWTDYLREEVKCKHGQE